MKIAVSLLIVLAIGLAVAIARPWQSRGGDIAKAEAATTRPSDASLGVDDLMRNVDRHKGRVSVVGVVSGASADKQLVALIDTKEFAACNSTECAELVLPVRWAGAMPAVRQTVRVNGEVQDSGGKLMFVANALEITK